MIIPDSLEDIQKWVSSRIRMKKSFKICGKGTRFVDSISLESKLIPSDILSLQKLKGKRFFDPEDMVVCLESGMSVRKMNQILGKRNMFLPVNPWFSDSCVGSVVACNDLGPNRMNMGGLRDCILGIEYVNGKGEIVKAGGKVVKNVSGYDITRMLLGSQGGFGVITAVTFKLTPLPEKPFGMYGIFENEAWLSKVKELHEYRIPLDWVQGASTSDSKWILGLGYSGNLLKRTRIENEIKKIFGEKLVILPDGELFSGQNFTPGENRYNGFLKSFSDIWKLDRFHFHLFATLTTENTLSFPIDFFLKEDLKILIHPIGGDIHFLHKSTNSNDQLKLLEKIKSILVDSDSKLRWVSGAPKNSLNDLGEFAITSSFPLIKRLKNHLDPVGVFSAPYYDLGI